MTDATLSAAGHGSTLPWWKQPHLLKLNFIILSLVMFCE
jgi:hypothetical protein